MTSAAKESVNPVPAVRARWWLLALGVVPLIGTALLAGRLIWEQTVWTWERGPQMVGFSLAHGSGAVLLLAPFLLAIWVAVGGVLMVIDFVKKRRTDTPTWAAGGWRCCYSGSYPYRAAFGKECSFDKWRLLRAPVTCLYTLHTTEIFDWLRRCCRMASAFGRLTSPNGEPHSMPPQLQVTCAPFSFLCQAGQT
jgi:hypothetical protein